MDAVNGQLSRVDSATELSGKPRLHVAIFGSNIEQIQSAVSVRLLTSPHSPDASHDGCRIDTGACRSVIPASQPRTVRTRCARHIDLRFVDWEPARVAAERRPRNCDASGHQIFQRLILRFRNGVRVHRWLNAVKELYISLTDSSFDESVIPVISESAATDNGIAPSSRPQLSRDHLILVT